jgi:phage recombination protein Bet
MSGEASVTLIRPPSAVDVGSYFTPEQRELLKRQIAKGVTDDELALFIFQCARTGLDPFSRQIYCIVRAGKMTIQTGIDGFRLIAERSKRYAPGPEPVYEYDAGGRVRKATAYVLKRTDDGTWHSVAASAYYEEYVVLNDRKQPLGLWAKPHIMLGKCAEALALRRAFPAELSGLYTAEEMAQAGPGEVDAGPEYTPPPKTSLATSRPADAKPAPAPAAPPPPPAEKTPPAQVDDRALRITKLCMMKRPEGLGWTKVGAKGWLRKRFGVDSTGLLTDQQKRDAETLLVARMMDDDEQTYREHVALLASQGRCQGDPASAADEDGVL